MKTSELLAVLTALIAKHGDQQVGMFNGLEHYFEPIDDVLARRSIADDDARLGEVYFGIAPYAIGDENQQLDRL